MDEIDPFPTDTFVFEDEGPFDNTGVIVITDDNRTLTYGEYVVEFQVDQDGDGVAEGMDEDPYDLGIGLGLGLIETPSTTLADLLANPLDERETAPIIGLVQYDSTV
jgi:hypothetical protein